MIGCTRLLLVRDVTADTGLNDFVDLWTIRIDGSQLTQLTNTAAHLTDLGWGDGGYARRVPPLVPGWRIG